MRQGSFLCQTDIGRQMGQESDAVSQRCGDASPSQRRERRISAAASLRLRRHFGRRIGTGYKVLGQQKPTGAGRNGGSRYLREIVMQPSGIEGMNGKAGGRNGMAMPLDRFTSPFRMARRPAPGRERDCEFDLTPRRSARRHGVSIGRSTRFSEGTGLARFHDGRM